MEYLYSKGEITMTLGDYYSGNTTREDETHHWTWFATNGKSAQENFMIQRQEIYNRIEMQSAISEENEITDLNVNIKTVVK